MPLSNLSLTIIIAKYHVLVIINKNQDVDVFIII